MNKFELSNLFKEKGATLGAAESFTGGLFAAEITSVSGASQFFKGSLITYATEEKERVLGIPREEIQKYGVISRETAFQMASAAKRILDVDFAVAFTGNAGPEVMDFKPVGEVHIAVAYSAICQVYSYSLSGTREEIRKEAIKIAYELLEKLLK